MYEQPTTNLVLLTQVPHLIWQPSVAFHCTSDKTQRSHHGLQGPASGPYPFLICSLYYSHSGLFKFHWAPAWNTQNAQAPFLKGLKDKNQQEHFPQQVDAKPKVEKGEKIKKMRFPNRVTIAFISTQPTKQHIWLDHRQINYRRAAVYNARASWILGLSFKVGEF